MPVGGRMAGERFFEIDAVKGVAVILMVVFHLLFDLDFLAGYRFDLSSGVWLLVGRSAAVLFLLFVGVNLTISRSRAVQKGLGGNALFVKYLKRGAWIFLLGLLITAATFLLFPRETIWFGVLHLIGVSVILAYPFLRFKWLNAALGTAVIATGLWLWNLSFPFPWLLPLGFQPAGFVSFDYFPILPAFGVVLLGIALGNVAYKGGARRWAARFPDLHFPRFRALEWMGRHSLLVYFVHQPVLIALVLALGAA
jgi:uncharacterized membrane protein